MGVDCSLIFGYENGAKEIELDRSYVFSRVGLNKWFRRTELIDKINEILNLKDNNGYSNYWMGYTKACLEHLFTNEDVKFVALVEDNKGLISSLYDNRERVGLKRGTHELVPLETPWIFLK